MEPKLDSLARTLRQLPENRPILLLLTHAARSVGELQPLAVALECWMSVSQVTHPDPAMLLRFGAESLENLCDQARLGVRLALGKPAAVEA